MIADKFVRHYYPKPLVIFALNRIAVSSSVPSLKYLYLYMVWKKWLPILVASRGVAERLKEEGKLHYSSPPVFGSALATSVYVQSLRKKRNPAVVLRELTHDVREHGDLYLIEWFEQYAGDVVLWAGTIRELVEVAEKERVPALLKQIADALKEEEQEGEEVEAQKAEKKVEAQQAQKGQAVSQPQPTQQSGHTASCSQSASIPQQTAGQSSSQGPSGASTAFSQQQSGSPQSSIAVEAGTEECDQHCQALAQQLLQSAFSQHISSRLFSMLASLVTSGVNVLKPVENVIQSKAKQLIDDRLERGSKSQGNTGVAGLEVLVPEDYEVCMPIANLVSQVVGRSITQLLRQLLRSVWYVRDRRVDSVFLPGQVPGRGTKITVHVLVDVSGSISPDELKYFVSVLNNEVLRKLRDRLDEKSSLVFWSTQVEDVKPLLGIEKRLETIPSGGGTAPESALTWLEDWSRENHKAPEVLVLLSDGWFFIHPDLEKGFRKWARKAKKAIAVITQNKGVAWELSKLGWEVYMPRSGNLFDCPEEVRA